MLYLSSLFSPAPDSPRRRLALALGAILVSGATACSPAKEVKTHALEMNSSRAEASGPSALSPRGAAQLRQLLSLYEPAEGFNGADTATLFRRFQPALLPVAEQSFRQDPARYDAADLWRKLAATFPPLAWAEKGDLSSAATLRSTLALAYPEATPLALDEVQKRLCEGDRASPERILKTGLAIGALSRAEESLRPIFTKVTALYHGEGSAPWAAAILGAVVGTSDAPTVDTGDASTARQIHRALFTALTLPEGLPWSRAQVEQLDWNLDRSLAAREDGTLLRAARARFPRALARHREGEGALRKQEQAARLLSWQVLTATEALLGRCGIDSGDPQSEAELLALLAQSAQAGDEKAACSLAASALGAKTDTRRN